MRKFYQTEWQGISFESFCSVSSTTMADTKFYEAFYKEFFKRNAAWSDISPRWIATKNLAAQLIASRISSHDLCLSIGCGLGYIEKQLIETHKCDLHVTETSAAPLKWLAPLLTSDRLYIGFFPDCLPSDCSYDFIFLSGVDYCFDQKSWEQFLLSVRSKLTDKGRCLIISGSLQQESMKGMLRYAISDLLVKLGIRKLGQFWGYLRTKSDYRSAMITADFLRVQEGIISDGSYWIEGQLEEEPHR